MVGMAVVMMPISVMMVRLPLHIYNLGRHSQSGRSFVFKKLCDVLCNNGKKQDEEKCNKQFLKCLRNSSKLSLSLFHEFTADVFRGQFQK